MSAKIISSLTEENRDLQKQIGCMNGLFQLFDRHYFVAGGRRTSSGHNQKKLIQGANHNESKAAAEKATASIPKNQDVALKDKPRFSAESPRTSSSSFSCPSTLSLLDRDKTVQSGRPPSSPRNSSESPTRTTLQQKSPSLRTSQQSVDLRDVIKDSMHREHRVLSVKTTNKEEGVGHTLKHIDSPRPSQQLKCGQSRIARRDASIRTLAKPQETPRSSREEKDGCTQLVRKDLPRFSYDGRETRDAFKGIAKLKELPRLSLDSRESSLRNSISESRSNFLLRNLQQDNGNTNLDPGSNKRPSNVVVKLMGLEAFPESNPRKEGEVTKLHSETRSSEKASDRNKKPSAFSPQIVQKDPVAPQLRNTSLAMKPTSNSTFSLEPAPWRQSDANRDAPRTATKDGSGCANATHASFTVYGEIEKRISELEFKTSGKDLRALKQILEAMQKSRKKLEIQNGDEADSVSETSRSSSEYSRSNQVSTASNYQHNQSYPLAQSKDPYSPKRLNSSIIIPKGARPTKSCSLAVTAPDASGLQRLRTQLAVYRTEDTIDKLAAKDLTPINSALKDTGRSNSCTEKKSIVKTLKTGQTSKAPRMVKPENYAAIGRSSGSISPRFQGMKQGLDKQSRKTNPTSDSSKARRRSSRSPTESKSSTRNVTPKSAVLQRGNYRANSDGNTRNFSHQGDTTSVLSESNSSLASQTETEVTSTGSPIEINGTSQIKPKERDFTARMSDDMSFSELSIPATEQPSPVSVLDATFYREDPPSPVKKISTVFQDYRTPEPEEAEWNLDNPGHLSDSEGPKVGCKLNQKKLENTEHLVHKLELLSDTCDEASTDKLETLSRTPNPDNKYITKLLLASGLINSLGTFSTVIPLHSSGHLINPNMFHVLEQTEQYTESVNQEQSTKIASSKSDKKTHRKILFDTANEILIHKLASESPFMPKKRTKDGRELLKELKSEIDRLQATPNSCSFEDDNFAGILNADMMQQPDEWTDFRGDIPAVVLDIERLIFKDLITELLIDEGVDLCDWPRRHCRKL